MKTFNYTTTSKTILADLYTPVGVYMRLRDLYPQSALMESSDYHDANNSRSFIGINPIASVAIGHGIATVSYPDGSTMTHEVNKDYRSDKAIHALIDQIEEAFTISAGLDYPGVGPMHCNMAKQGRTQVLSINDNEAIYGGYELTRMEGIIPAIESAHAIAALKKLSFKPSDVVVLTVSGRGDKDVETYLKNKQMAKEYGNF